VHADRLLEGVVSPGRLPFALRQQGGGDRVELALDRVLGARL
jgi:hypothetical protein